MDLDATEVILRTVEQEGFAIMDAMTTSDANPTARLKLAELVRNRRLELGLSVRQAADRGDVARGTWTALEEGTRRTADNNYAGIERALHWAPGSIATILDGGAPTALRAEQADSTAQGQEQTRSGDGIDPITRVMRSDLTDEQKKRLVRMLINEREAAERQLEQRADELIRLLRDDH